MVGKKVFASESLMVCEMVVRIVLLSDSQSGHEIGYGPLPKKERQ